MRVKLEGPVTRVKLDVSKLPYKEISGRVSLSVKNLVWVKMYRSDSCASNIV